MQTKRQSVIEAIINVFIGFLITLLFSPFIYSICNVEIKYSQMGTVTFCFTVLSVLRGYVLRRFFNHKHSKKLTRYNSVEEMNNSTVTGKVHPDIVRKRHREYAEFIQYLKGKMQ